MHLFGDTAILDRVPKFFFSLPPTTFRWVVLGRSCRLVKRSLEKGLDVYPTSFGTCGALLCLWSGRLEHSCRLVVRRIGETEPYNTGVLVLDARSAAYYFRVLRWAR